MRGVVDMRLRKSSKIGIAMIASAAMVGNDLARIPRQTIPIQDRIIDAADAAFVIGSGILFYVHVWPWLLDVNKMILGRLGLRR